MKQKLFSVLRCDKCGQLEQRQVGEYENASYEAEGELTNTELIKGLKKGNIGISQRVSMCDGCCGDEE